MEGWLRACTSPAYRCLPVSAKQHACVMHAGAPARSHATHLQPRSRKNPLLIFSGLDILKAHLKVKYEAHKCTKWIRKNAPERVQATSVNVSAETQRAFECGECAACHVSLDPCATARGVQVQGWTHVHAFMSGEWIRRRHSDEQQKRCTRFLLSLGL